MVVFNSFALEHERDHEKSLASPPTLSSNCTVFRSCASPSVRYACMCGFYQMVALFQDSKCPRHLLFTPHTMLKLRKGETVPRLETFY